MSISGLHLNHLIPPLHLNLLPITLKFGYAKNRADKIDFFNLPDAGSPSFSQPLAYGKLVGVFKCFDDRLAVSTGSDAQGSSSLILSLRGPISLDAISGHYHGLRTLCGLTNYLH